VAPGQRSPDRVPVLLLLAFWRVVGGVPAPEPVEPEPEPVEPEPVEPEPEPLSLDPFFFFLDLDSLPDPVSLEEPELPAEETRTAGLTGGRTGTGSSLACATSRACRLGKTDRHRGRQKHD